MTLIEWKGGTMMKVTKLAAIFMFLLVAATIVGMYLMNQTYWDVYNWVTLICCTVLGFLLLKQK
jgi:uncharacterized protein (DUF983 family)